MWSHYADGHRGFVIGFDADNPFFQPGKWNVRAGLEAVSYVSQRYKVPAEGLVDLPPAEMEAAGRRIFLTKSPDWAYEQELRMIAHPSHADKRIPGPRCDICLYAFPPECVTEIIVGSKSEPEFRNRMRETVKRKYPHASMYHSLLDDTEYNMRKEPFNGEDMGRLLSESVLAPFLKAYGVRASHPG
jgi:hypothetical protein